MERPVDILDTGEVRKIMGGLNPKTVSGAMQLAVIALMYRCGLRIAEVLGKRDDVENSGLMLGHVDLERGTVRVVNGKRGKNRVVGMDAQTVEYVKKWLDVRCECEDKHLFVTSRGKPVNHMQLKRTLRRCAEKAGITKRIHPHGLRHTHAVELLKENTNPMLIMKQLGHSSLDTTMKYLDHINQEEVVGLGKEREW